MFNQLKELAEFWCQNITFFVKNLYFVEFATEFKQHS